MPEDGAVHITLPFFHAELMLVYGVSCKIKIGIKTIVPSISVALI
jgi:hypothetical protein